MNIASLAGGERFNLDANVISLVTVGDSQSDVVHSHSWILQSSG